MKTQEQQKRIDQKIAQINEFCGLQLVKCNDFPGVIKNGNKEYFNVILKKRVWDSREYLELERLVNKGIISAVGPNGVYRVAVFF